MFYVWSTGLCYPDFLQILAQQNIFYLQLDCHVPELLKKFFTGRFVRKIPACLKFSGIHNVRCPKSCHLKPKLLLHVNCCLYIQCLCRDGNYWCSDVVFEMPSLPKFSLKPGLEITASQQTMSGLIEDLTSQTFALRVTLTSQIPLY